MQVKISDGSLVEITENVTKVVIKEGVFPQGVGPFLVVGFDGELPVILLSESEKAPISPELIVGADNPDAEKVEVKLPSGEVVLVPVDVAPILDAFIKMNEDLVSQLAKVLSGSELEALKKDLELKQAELDVAVAKVEQLGGALPAVEGAREALAKVAEALSG